MSRARKKKASSVQPDRSGLAGALAVWTALFSCGFLWPSEGAIEGDGLHLALLWLLGLAGVFFYQRWLSTADVNSTAVVFRTRWIPERLTSPDGLVTMGCLLFLAGTWASTWYVFHVAGDRRAALNLAFAWTGIGASALLARLLAADGRCRHAMIQLIAGLGVGVAVFSLWHSQVYYAREGERYLEQRRILEEGTDALAVSQARQEFARQGIPLDGPGRDQFEQRLLSSTEPFGPFALANTLAGVLAVSVVLIAGTLLSTYRHSSWRWTEFLLPLLALSLVVWCLVLTKSRTAWTGTAVGLAVVLLVRPLNGDMKRSGVSRLLQVVMVLGLAAAVLLTAGLLTGVIDREVVLESPRSLQFRLFYWMGAAGVIGETPFFGAGPGNFRQLYLAHKPVESSESILDPHNIYLDAWGFAGVAGFVGMLLLTVGVLRSLRSVCDEPVSPGRAPLRTLMPGLAGCLVIHFGWMWLSGQVLTAQDLMLAAAVLVGGFASTVVGTLRWNPVAPAAATVALLVHLLGAGGLQITVVGLLVLGLATLATPLAIPETARDNNRVGTWRLTMGSAVSATIAAGILWWGLMPLQSSTVQQSIGQIKLGARDIRGATSAFQQAAAADPLSPTLRQHVVQAVSYSVMQQDPAQKTTEAMVSAQEVTAIEAACDQHIESDTRAIQGILTRARIYHQLYRLTNQSVYIESCVQDLRQVVTRDPTDAALRVELAYCEQAAGDQAAAQESAEQALQIEQVNRAWSHSDQYLDEADLQIIDDIKNGESP